MYVGKKQGMLKNFILCLGFYPGQTTQRMGDIRKTNPKTE